MLRTDLPRGTPSLIDRDARARHLDAADRAGLTPAPRPVILVPTPAQLARGQRVIEATDEQCPAALLRLREAALTAGWAVRTGYSHALHPPKRGGEDWYERHHVTLRIAHEGRGQRGYGAWADGAWDGAVVLPFTRPLGAAQFAEVIAAGVLVPPKTATCPLCRAEVKVLKSGALAAHKFADARCPATTGVRQ
jgi:hypothetical protein